MKGPAGSRGPYVFHRRWSDICFDVIHSLTLITWLCLAWGRSLPRSCRRIYQFTSAADWPRDPQRPLSSLSFRPRSHVAFERRSMKRPARRKACAFLIGTLVPPPLFLHRFLIYSRVSAAFCWAQALSPPRLESPGGVNSSSAERYIICWDSHVIQEGVRQVKKKKKSFGKDDSDTLSSHHFYFFLRHIMNKLGRWI